MAQVQKLAILQKINHFETDPKSAVINEIQFIIDDQKRNQFEELRDEFLSQS